MKRCNSDDTYSANVYSLALNTLWGGFEIMIIIMYVLYIHVKYFNGSFQIFNRNVVSTAHTPLKVD